MRFKFGLVSRNSGLLVWTSYRNIRNQEGNRVSEEELITEEIENVRDEVNEALKKATDAVTYIIKNGEPDVSQMTCVDDIVSTTVYSILAGLIRGMSEMSLLSDLEIWENCCAPISTLVDNLDAGNH